MAVRILPSRDNGCLLLVSENLLTKISSFASRNIILYVILSSSSFDNASNKFSTKLLPSLISTTTAVGFDSSLPRSFTKDANPESSLSGRLSTQK